MTPTPSPPGWEPIETAPRDGTAILLRLGKIVGSGCYRQPMRFGAGPKAFCFDGATLPSEATEWQPLPPPPTETAP